MNCTICDDQYGRSCRIPADDELHFMDSFECAFYTVAPRCRCCDRRIVDHGIETWGNIFCCTPCVHEWYAGANAMHRPHAGLGSALGAEFAY